jgi:hypothetical protein
LFNKKRACDERRRICPLFAVGARGEPAHRRAPANAQIQINSMAAMEGFKLTRPTIQAQNIIPVTKDGSFDFKDHIYEEKCFERETWGLAYTNKVTEPEAFSCLDIIRQGG